MPFVSFFFLFLGHCIFGIIIILLHWIAILEFLMRNNPSTKIAQLTLQNKIKNCAFWKRAPVWWLVAWKSLLQAQEELSSSWWFPGTEAPGPAVISFVIIAKPDGHVSCQSLRPRRFTCQLSLAIRTRGRQGSCWKGIISSSCIIIMKNRGNTIGYTCTKFRSLGKICSDEETSRNHDDNHAHGYCEGAPKEFWPDRVATLCMGKKTCDSGCHCVSWGNAPSRETQLFSCTCSPKGVKTHVTLSPERLPENARESWTRTKKVVFNFARSVTLWAIEISPPITSTSNMGTCVSKSLRSTGRCDRRHLKYCQLPRLKEENFLSLTSAIKCSI